MDSKEKAENRIMYIGIIGLIVFSSYWGMWYQDVPFTETVIDGFTGVGIGTSFVKIVFGK